LWDRWRVTKIDKCPEMSSIESYTAEAPRDLCDIVTVENAQVTPYFDHQVIMETINGQILVAIAGERTSNAVVRAIDFLIPLSYYGFRNECFDAHWCMHNFTPVNWSTKRVFEPEQNKQTVHLLTCCSKEARSSVNFALEWLK
jgi:hypothetical protein